MTHHGEVSPSILPALNEQNTNTVEEETMTDELKKAIEKTKVFSNIYVINQGHPWGVLGVDHLRLSDPRLAMLVAFTSSSTALLAGARAPHSAVGHASAARMTTMVMIPRHSPIIR